MRTVRTHALVAVSANGHPIATLQLPNQQDVGPNNNLAFMFNQVDSYVRQRLKYICISPETISNPERFRFNE